MVELEMRMPMPLAKGKPDGETPGWVGLIAMDVTDPERTVYKCVTASAGVYTWVPMSTGGGGGSGGSGGSGVSFIPGNALALADDGTLNVVTTGEAEAENNLPITSAGVHAVAYGLRREIENYSASIPGTVENALAAAKESGELAPTMWVLGLRVTTPSNGNVIAELYKDGVICTDRMYLRTYVSSQGGEWRVHGTGSGYFTGEKSWSYGGGDEGVAWKCEVYADGNMTEMLALASATTGTKGAPGHTPVKGTDYFTDADKAEIAAAAASRVDTSGLVPKTGTTMTGALVAQTNANYTTRQMRNVIYLAEGASVPTTQNGDLVLFYK